MAIILVDVYEPYLSNLGFITTGEPSIDGRGGRTYELAPDAGSGRYWVYPVSDSCVISSYSVVFNRDFEFCQSYPPFLYFGMFESATFSKAPTKEKRASTLKGYVANQGEYRMQLRKDDTISSVGIAMTREFCETHLWTGLSSGATHRHPAELGMLTEALDRMDGSAIIPELTWAFHQIKSFRPVQPVAKVYYESKIMEMLAYVLQWHTLSETGPLNELPDSDRAGLCRVEEHLRSNYARPDGLQKLASMACMSPNKLTALFKRIQGQTITEYVQSMRLDRAKDMLLHSSRKIETIALDVGYRDHGSFTKLFKRSTGMTPLQFRSHGLSNASLS